MKAPEETKALLLYTTGHTITLLSLVKALKLLVELEQSPLEEKLLALITRSIAEQTMKNLMIVMMGVNNDIYELSRGGQMAK